MLWLVYLVLTNLLPSCFEELRSVLEIAVKKLERFKHLLQYQKSRRFSCRNKNSDFLLTKEQDMNIRVISYIFIWVHIFFIQPYEYEILLTMKGKSSDKNITHNVQSVDKNLSLLNTFKRQPGGKSNRAERNHMPFSWQACPIITPWKTPASLMLSIQKLNETTKATIISNQNILSTIHYIQFWHGSIRQRRGLHSSLERQKPFFSCARIKVIIVSHNIISD